jgi:DNA-binding transcriptional ArsR family regulator
MIFCVPQHLGVDLSDYSDILRQVTNYQEDLNSIFTALADPTRRAVLAKLCEAPSSVSELAKPFDMALPSFTQHLKVLEESGLVKSKKKGRVRTYSVAPKKLTKANKWLEERRATWEQRFDRLENYLRKIQEQK